MNPLISSAWLANRLHDPGVIVLDATLPPVGVLPKVDTRARYLAGHLPGAVFFDIEELSDQTTSLPHMLPTAEAFSASMSALGVDDSATIVIYEQEGVFSAPRAWWMLRTFGAQNVYLLDGGLSAWTDAGHPVESGPVERLPASFHARLDAASVWDLNHMQAMIAGRGKAEGERSGQILDARSAGRFRGTAPEPRPGLSSGHMPGAISVPFTDLAEGGRLKGVDQLRALFSARGVDLDQPIVTTCGSGVTAAVVALGLEIAGARQVSLYDGSWAEYAQHPEALIEKSA